MDRRALGRTGLVLSSVGYGAFKIGRNEGIKYPSGYALPDEREVRELLEGLLELGITYFDTAPAYGLSEERLGNVLGPRRDELVLSTKVGETFHDGRSTYDFSRPAIEASVARSLERLRTDAVDLLLIHSDGRDLLVQQQTDAVETLQTIKQRGLARAIGFSGKTPAGAEAALGWADAIMVEYSIDRRDHEAALASAAEAGVGVIVKKGLASGHLPAGESIRFVLGNPAVSSLVIGSLSLAHMTANVAETNVQRSDEATASG